MSPRAHLFRFMQGLVTFYKPPNIDAMKFRRKIADKVAREFNQLPWETERLRTSITYPGQSCTVPSISNSVDVINNALVIGKRFESADVVLNIVNPLPDFASGIQVVGIGDKGAYEFVDAMYKSRFLKSYHLTGMLGQISSDGLSTGSTLYRTPWRHVSRPKLDRVLSSLEFKARSASLLQAGLVPNTQKAFEALSNPERVGAPMKPMIEPSEHLPPDHVTSYWDRRPEPTQPHTLRASPDPSSVQQIPPALRAIRCIDFKPPFFTIEIQVLYESGSFLIDLMANIGASLRSSCVLTKARRLRHGPFAAKDSLLLKECTVPLSVYEKFIELRSEPPTDDFDGEDEYRRFVLTRLFPEESRQNHLFSNLVHCSYDETFQAALKPDKP